MKAAIAEILNESDIEGLISIGTPADEYDSEARQIADGLSKFAAGGRKPGKRRCPDCAHLAKIVRLRRG